MGDGLVKQERVMTLINETIDRIREDILSSQKVLQAIGDETRQHIILALMEAPCGIGMRVGEITERTHLSRPAVSHHLRVLKEAQVISMRKEGTMNFYSIEVNGGFHHLISLCEHIKEFAAYVNPDQEENDQ